MPLTQILGFVCGILAVQSLRELPQFQWLLLLCIPALLPWRLRPQSAMFVLGVLLACWRGQGLLDQRWPVERHDQELWVEGRIASLPEWNLAPKRNAADGEPQRIWRFLFEPVAPELPQRIRVAWYPRPALGDEPVRAAECWRLRLRLKTPHGSLNPGAFDYEGWLFRQGIGATATVREAQRCAAVEGYALLRWRQSLVDQLRDWLPQHRALGLVAALTLGDTSMLSAADWTVFRLTGTTHLVAISGFNIAIVSGIAFFVFRWLWSLWPPLGLRLPAQKAGMLGAALVSLGYALLAGFEPPVARAAIMLWVLLAAAWLHRLTQAARVLALAAFAILLLDPLAAMAPGLWLSFSAVAAIFYVSSHRLGETGWLRSAVRLQFMLSVALTPLTLYFFHGAAWAAPLVNLIAVPLITVLTPVLLGALALAWAWPAAGVPALRGIADALSALREGLGWIAQQGPQLWIPASPPLTALLLALAGAALLFAPHGLPLKRYALLCFLPLLWPPQIAPRTGFELTVLDVGQGLATVIRTAQHTLVFDTGPAFEEGFDAGESIVAPFLLGQGAQRVDLLLISHADNDHSGGAPALRRLLRVQDERGARTAHPCHDGQRWQWEGVDFRVLHPADPAASGNNSSCVLRVSTGTQIVLLTGDIEKAAEQRLLKDHAQDLRAQLLIAPHHGSKTSSTAPFIEAVGAHTVIFSAGWKHHFHHPHPSVVERYALSGAQMFDTGWSGALSVEVDTQTLSPLRAWRERASRYWNAPYAQMPPE